MAVIPVGELPRGLAVDQNRNIVYVPNWGCNTISEINGTTNKLNSAITFTTDAPRSGIISCNSTGKRDEFKNNDYLRIDDGKRLVCNTNANFISFFFVSYGV